MPIANARRGRAPHRAFVNKHSSDEIANAKGLYWWKIAREHAQKHFLSDAVASPTTHGQEDRVENMGGAGQQTDTVGVVGRVYRQCNASWDLVLYFGQ